MPDDVPTTAQPETLKSDPTCRRPVPATEEKRAEAEALGSTKELVIEPVEW